MIKKQRISFQHFLEKFPEIDLPITLSEDIHFEFSRNNDPLSDVAIQQFIIRHEEASDDEHVEYVPCFRLKKTEKFHAVVYWKASLLNYQYVLLTFDLKENLIDRSIIAGTKVEKDTLMRSVATIDEDWIIYVMAGVASASSNIYDASSSKSFHLEILATGKIINTD